MAITVFSDLILDEGLIAIAGLNGKNHRKNSRVELEDGDQTINIVWANALRDYDFGFIPMIPEDWRKVESIFEVTKGGAYGFLMKDPKDSYTATGVATELSAGVYQLWNRYIEPVSSRFSDRKITRPILAGFVIKTSGAPITSYTLDVETGQITIPSAPAASTLTWVGNFYVPVHFVNDELTWELNKGGPYAGRLTSSQSALLREVRE